MTVTPITCALTIATLCMAVESPMVRAAGSRTLVSVPAPSPRVPLVGRVAPRLSFGRSFNSAHVSLKQLQGHVVLLDFWSITCSPCVAAMPKLVSLKRHYKTPEFVIVMLHSPVVAVPEHGGPREMLVEDFIEKHGITLPVALATEETFTAFGVSALPLYVVIDRAGVVRYQSSVFPSTEFVETVLRGR